jgi:hypothetical protein
VKWGIVFKLPAAYESELWTQEFPSPSYMQRLNRSDGSYILMVYYHFEYTPQSWKEWQQVATIKVQIKNRIQRAELHDYIPSEVTGPIYSISELGKSFRAQIMFPKPLYPKCKREAYKMLCRYAKRLHYYRLLDLEQLIATSFRFNAFEKVKEGPSQTVKRAKGAYMMALKYRDSWPIKLSDSKRHEVFRSAAFKTAAIKRADPRRREAIFFRKEGKKLHEICYLLGVSRSTIMRWLKESMSHLPLHSMR